MERYDLLPLGAGCLVAPPCAHCSEPSPRHRVPVPAGGLLVADFGAPWCGPCVAVKPLFAALSLKPEFAGVTFARLDAEMTPQLMGDHQVTNNADAPHEMGGAYRRELRGASRFTKKDGHTLSPQASTQPLVLWPPGGLVPNLQVLPRRGGGGPSRGGRRHRRRRAADPVAPRRGARHGMRTEGRFSIFLFAKKRLGSGSLPSRGSSSRDPKTREKSAPSPTAANRTISLR